MTQFFGADVEQEITPTEVLQAVPSLDGVLHRCGQLTVRAAKLLQQHVAKLHIRRSDIDRIHQFLHMVIHRLPSSLIFRSGFRAFTPYDAVYL